MGAVTQPETPSLRHRSTPLPATSRFAESVDELIDSFVQRFTVELNDACEVLRDAFVRDDNSRLIPFHNRVQSDRQKMVGGCSRVACRIRSLFDAVADDTGAPEAIESVWHGCIQRACSAALSVGKGVEPIEAFACGLVRDLGRVALIAAYPKAYGRVLRAVRTGADDLRDVETRSLGTDHVVVGGQLLSHLSVPASLKQSNELLCSLADGDSHDHVIAVEQMVRDIESQLQHKESKGLVADHRELSQPVVSVGDASSVGDNSANASPTLLRLMQQIAELPNRAYNLDQLCSETARMVLDVLGIRRFVVFAQTEPNQYRVCVFDGIANTLESPFELQRVIVRESAHAATADVVLAHDANETTHRTLADRFVRLFGPGAIGLLSFRHRTSQPGGMLFSQDGDGERLNQIDDASLQMISQSLGAVFESTLLERRLDSQTASVGLPSCELQSTIRSETINRVAQLAAGAAHEFNNPLAIIAGKAQFLQGDPRNQSIQLDLQLIAAQARRAGEMVERLMDYARPQNPNPVEIRLDIWANRLRQHWHRESGFAPDQIQVDLVSDGLTMFADEEQLCGAANAIIENSVESIRAKIGPGGIKSVDFANIQINSPSASTDDTIVVAISDNGGGMPPDVLEHALDPFFSHREAGRRQGLGLSRAARYIEVNGGRLWIESKEGVGTTVRFSVPARSGKPLG